MSENDNPTVPDESTSLLRKDASRTVDPSFSGNGLSNGNAVAEADANVESGEAGDANIEGGEGRRMGEDNALLEERKVTRLNLLIPAVAIGVCLDTPFARDERLLDDGGVAEGGLGY